MSDWMKKNGSRWFLRPESSVLTPHSRLLYTHLGISAQFLGAGQDLRRGLDGTSTSPEIASAQNQLRDAGCKGVRRAVMLVTEAMLEV